MERVATQSKAGRGSQATIGSRSPADNAIRLQEREGEWAGTQEALDLAAGGAGRVVCLVGPAGIGKTALLEAAAAEAEDRGFAVLRARGSELERGLPFGLSRQLFIAHLRRLSTDTVGSLLEGPAGLAADALGLLRRPATESRSRPRWRSEGGVEHGLYWLVSNLSELAPLALIIDDAQWADEPSTRFLTYLASRVEHLPVALLMTLRQEEGSTHQAVAAVLSSRSDVDLLAPAPLSRHGVAALIGEQFTAPGSDSFLTACHRAAGGNPFLTQELLRELVRQGASPDDRGAQQVFEMRPANVIASVKRRLDLMGRPATLLASAVAVLGSGVELRRAAIVADLDAATAAEAADTLIDAALLQPGRPLGFVHPIVEAAVRELLPAALSDTLHRRAFGVLRAEEADPIEAASHLLWTEPNGEADALDALWSAAVVSAQRADPKSAAGFLSRALREPVPSDRRGRFLHALGEARLASGDPAGLDDLERALQTQSEPRARAGVLLSLATARYERGDVPGASEALRQGLNESLEPGDELQVSLQAARVTIERSADALSGGEAQRAAENILASPEAGRTSLERLVLAQMAFHGMWSGQMDHLTVVALARRAIPPDHLRHRDARDALVPPLVGMALYFSDAFEDAERLFSHEIERAQAAGSQLQFATASFFRGVSRFLAGRLRDAIDDWQSTFDTVEEGWAFALPSLRALRAFAALERDASELARELLELPGGDEPWREHPTFPYVLAIRGVERLASGDLERGLELVMAAGEAQEARGCFNPSVLPWQSEAAPAAYSLGRQEQAQQLAEVVLERSLAFGAPRAVGIAQRACGVVHGRDGIALLEESVRTLEPSGAELELARSLLELGASLRRLGRRQQAREQLARALDVADRIGGLTIARRAQEELRQAGGRPRRVRTSGLDSLTASERRVAVLAAAGHSNREIAQQLFVTLRTVETHLTHVYSKLDIKSRPDLPAVLEGSGHQTA